MATINANFSEMYEVASNLEGRFGAGGELDQVVSDLKELRTWVDQFETLTKQGEDGASVAEKIGLTAATIDFRGKKIIELAGTLRKAAEIYERRERDLSSKLSLEAHGGSQEAGGSMTTDWTYE